MVNLTFCRLDVFLIRSSLITPKHNIHLFPFISLQRDDHSCWNFFVDLLRTSDLVLSKLHWLFGHLLFGFRYPGEICFWFEGRSELWEDHGSWFRFAGCWWWYHGGFFQTTAGVRSDHGRFIFWTFLSSFDFFGGFWLLLCLCIILTWNPIDYLIWPLLLVVHQRFYRLGISSLCL